MTREMVKVELDAQLYRAVDVLSYQDDEAAAFFIQAAVHYCLLDALRVLRADNTYFNPSAKTVLEEAVEEWYDASVEEAHEMRRRLRDYSRNYCPF